VTTDKPIDLTHFNAAGEAYMVDVGEKVISQRIAIAEGYIKMQLSTLEKILQGTHKKGDVLGIARIAGIMAAKRTAEIIPLCHSLFLTKVEIHFQPDISNAHIYCQAQVKTTGQTGVEMEALFAVEVALLTIYDMCKAVDRGMVLTGIGLVEKKGGKSGHWLKTNET
jgi:cyclic pyranopterin phosphate synthase